MELITKLARVACAKRYLLVVLVATLVVSCSRVAIIRGERRKDEIESYTTVNSFLEYVRRKAPDSKVNVEEERLGITTVLVEGFGHHGETGRADATFLRDRLVGIWFYPKDPTAYLKEVKRLEGVDLKDVRTSRDAKVTRGNVETWMSEDHRRLAFVAREDKRLASEVDSVIKRHSAVPFLMELKELAPFV
jgi:hypothetical protein